MKTDTIMEVASPLPSTRVRRGRSVHKAHAPEQKLAHFLEVIFASPVPLRFQGT
jgi:hypothetical protein